MGCTSVKINSKRGTTSYLYRRRNQRQEVAGKSCKRERLASYRGLVNKRLGAGKQEAGPCAKVCALENGSP